MLFIIVNKSKFYNKNFKVKGLIIIKNKNSIKNIKIEFNWKNNYFNELKLFNKIKLKLLKNTFITVIKYLNIHPYKNTITNVHFLNLND